MCFLRVGEEDAIVSKQQLSDEFLDGFHAREETLRVEETALRMEMSSCRPSFASRGMMLKKMENNVGAGESLLDVVGDGEATRQRPIILCFT